MVVHAYDSSSLGGRDRRITSSRPDLGKGIANLSQKTKLKKKNQLRV
jgi:hypothetical protein